MQNPVGGAYKAGWNLAQEFNNMFLGYGGSHFKDGSTAKCELCGWCECTEHDEISVSLYEPWISSPMTVTPPMLNSARATLPL